MNHSLHLGHRNCPKYTSLTITGPTKTTIIRANKRNAATSAIVLTLYYSPSLRAIASLCVSFFIDRLIIIHNVPLIRFASGKYPYMITLITFKITQLTEIPICGRTIQVRAQSLVPSCTASFGALDSWPRPPSQKCDHNEDNNSNQYFHASGITRLICELLRIPAPLYAFTICTLAYP